MTSPTAWSSWARSSPSFRKTEGPAGDRVADSRLQAARLPAADHVKLATAAAGVVGTLVVFGVAFGMARMLPRSKPIEAYADAA